VGHIVEFEGPGGGSTFQACDDLADAVSLVERLRNDRGITRTRILRTEEIRFDFKPYYRVELGEPEPDATPDAPVVSNSTPLSRIVIAPASHRAETPEDDEAGGRVEDDRSEGVPVVALAGEPDPSPRRGLFGR
jgi:hypothetical protein